jgi:hypothetical protein
MVKRLRANLLSGLIGVGILVLGVVVGIFLVSQNQDYRNRAKEILNQTYTVCHRVGVTDNRWEEITVTAEELSQRLNEGDIFGKCPEGAVNGLNKQQIYKIN